MLKVWVKGVNRYWINNSQPIFIYTPSPTISLNALLVKYFKHFLHTPFTQTIFIYKQPINYKNPLLVYLFYLFSTPLTKTNILNYLGFIG